jgi:hypothetical protein
VTISTRVNVVNLTVPANTTAAAPQLTTVTLGDVWLHQVVVRTPAGHNGTTGYAITSNGTPVIPWGTPLTYLITNDELLEFPVEAEFDKFLVIRTTNTDVYAHSLYLRFFNTPMTLMTKAIEQADLISVT